MELIRLTYKFFLFNLQLRFTNQLNLSRYTIIIFSCVAILLFLMFLYLVVKMRKIAFFNKNMNSIFSLKLILIFASVVSTIYSILAFVVVISNAMNSSVCGFLTHLNNGNTLIFDSL